MNNQNHPSNKHKKKDINLGKLAGGLAVGLQTGISVASIILLALSGYLPNIFVGAFAIILLIFVFFPFIMIKNERTAIRVSGICISLIISILLIFALNYFIRISATVSNITDRTKQSSVIVVAVRADDPAATLQDAGSYNFGVQIFGSQPEIKATVSQIEQSISRLITTSEYNTPVEEAQALLDGEIDAAIYNSAYSEIFAEAIEGYSSKVKIIYEYEYVSSVETESADVSNAFNIYISGIDTEGDIATTSRSDVNIIMTVNPDTHTIMLSTTPRDYYVYIPGISGNRRDKLTHAGIYGINTSMRTLENLYDIKINEYIRVNFTSLITIIDAIGGVDVYSDYAFSSQGHSFTEGINHLDGEAALAFSRERHAFIDGDVQRGKNQEAVLEAVLKKIQSKEILTNAPALLTAVGESMQTSITREQITRLVSTQLSEALDWKIVKQTASGTGDTQDTFSGGFAYVMWPDETSVASVSRNIKSVLKGYSYSVE